MRRIVVGVVIALGVAVPAWAQEEEPFVPPPAAPPPAPAPPAAPPPPPAPVSASPEATAAYARAVNLMHQQQYAAAAEQFDIALRYDPMLTAARTGRGHAFIMLGDRFLAMGEKDQARIMYGKALEAEPRLADDPNFSARFRSVTAPEARAVPTYVKSEYEVERIYPREHKHFGVGLTLGLEGIFGIQVGVLLFGLVNPTVTYAPGFNTLDGSIKLTPLKYKWTPIIGAGYTKGWKSCSATETYHCTGLGQFSYFHFDLGVQLMTKHGFTMNMGVNLTNAPDDTDITWIPIPFMDWSWYF